MAVILGENRYGKSQVRLVTVRRHADHHELKDVTVAIALEGHFEACYTQGDNSGVLPTDTMKNTVYALAAEQPVGEIEDFGLRLSEHFLRHAPGSARVQIDLTEHLWERIEAGGTPHPHAFRRAGAERRTARVVRDQEGAQAAQVPRVPQVTAGIEELVVLKTAQSAFAGFPRDRYTTLPETHDRIFATAVEASWRYRRPDLPFGQLWQEVRHRLLETFAGHDSLSVQHTLYAMGEAALGIPEIEEIHLVLPNKHHLPVDLTRFGLENRNEIFVATEEPYGRIEATVQR